MQQTTNTIYPKLFNYFEITPKQVDDCLSNVRYFVQCTMRELLLIFIKHDKVTSMADSLLIGRYQLNLQKMSKLK